MERQMCPHSSEFLEEDIQAKIGSGVSRAEVVVDISPNQKVPPTYDFSTCLASHPDDSIIFDRTSQSS
ncbi:hypothetical protein CHS0354_012615, partial [Potamilus streckersoni]